MNTLFIKILAFVFYCCMSNAQIITQPANNTNLKFNQIGLEQGLSQSSVYAITQDALGFMWFGTDDGLNRYDGLNIMVFKNFPSNHNSIADNTVMSLLGDKNGNVWIGLRRGGVDKYNISENRFYHHSHNKHDSTTISDNAISVLFEDSNGNIWLGTKKGLNLFDQENNSSVRINLFTRDNSEKSANAVTAICEDHDRNLWIGTSNGLYKVNITNNQDIHRSIFHPSDIKSYYHIPTDLNSLCGNYIRSLYVDRSGTVWVGTFGNGLCRYRKETNNFSRHLDDDQSISLSNLGSFISFIYEDSKNNFWVATYDSGLYMLDRQLRKFYKTIDEPVMTMYEGNTGIIWIGTYTGGVKVYDPQKNRFNHYYEKYTDQSNKDINLSTSILEDRNGRLWIGTYNSGLKLYSPQQIGSNKRRKKITTYKYDPANPFSLSSDKITSLAESRDGSIWIGTENDGLNRFDSKKGRFIHYKHRIEHSNSISSNRITSLYYDTKEDLLWIGYLNGKIDSYDHSNNLFKPYRMETDDQLSVNSITVIYRGTQSGLWVGTFEGDLNRFIPESNMFSQFKLLSDPNMDKIKNGIYSIYEDTQGTLWFGTYGGGLKKLEPGNNFVKTYSEEEGLTNAVVYGILPDKSGNLWFSTNKGIFKFNPMKNNFRNYDVKDGLQSNEFNQGAYFRSKNGELFFGGVNGFNAFSPEDIVDNMFIPAVYIITIKVLDQVLQLPNPITSNIEQIVLNYSDNFFSFEFVALNYTSPDKNNYAYILEGFDKDWHTVSAVQRYASYTNLDPGKYVLRVKGSNNDGIWNEKGTSVVVVVTPPFWMTWWFRVLIIIVLISISIATVRYFLLKKIREKTRKLEQERAIEKERLRIARDMHDDLGARLTEIRYMVDLAKNNYMDKENKMLTAISQTTKDIISTFREIVWSVSPQNDTVESLCEYIGQYSVDYLSKVQIRCRLDFPEELPHINAPAEIRHNIFLAVKEALNNIVKYAETSEVFVKIFVENYMMVISIEDFGVGFDPCQMDKFGNGLKNMKKRIELVGGNFKIDSQTGKGTKLTFNVPLEKEPSFSN